MYNLLGTSFFLLKLIECLVHTDGLAFVSSLNLLQIAQNGETDKEEPERPGVIVSNHVSYLDILYHMSASFPSFVAKVSIDICFMVLTF